jgi:hypothetical protein
MLELIDNVDMINDQGNLPFGNKQSLRLFKTRIYGDNSSALNLAIKQKVTSRTKHWAVQFHFF